MSKKNVLFNKKMEVVKQLNLLRKQVDDDTAETIIRLIGAEIDLFHYLLLNDDDKGMI